MIHHKLLGQEQVARNKLRDPRLRTASPDSAPGSPTPEPWTPYASNRKGHPSIAPEDAVRSFWTAWQNVPVTFPRRDLPRVPDRWRTFGTRKSVLTGSPRLAVNPANATLNYLYTILLAEASLAIAAMGLDPGLGYLHAADDSYRDSLACDLMEPVRPEVDAFVFD